MPDAESEETISKELEELYDLSLGNDFYDMDKFEKNVCDEENISLDRLRK